MTTKINTNVATYLRDSNNGRLMSDVLNSTMQIEDQFALLQKEYRFKTVEAYLLLKGRDDVAYNIYRAISKIYSVGELNKRYAVC